MNLILKVEVEKTTFKTKLLNNKEKKKFYMGFLRSCLQSSRILTDSENVLQFIHYPKNSAVTKCTSQLLWKNFRKIYGGG